MSTKPARARRMGHLKPGEKLVRRDDAQAYIDYRLGLERERNARLYGPFSTFRWFLGGLREGATVLIGAGAYLIKKVTGNAPNQT